MRRSALEMKYLRAARLESVMLAPAAAALLYPFLLLLFTNLVGPADAAPSWAARLGAAVVLACALAVPFVAIVAACRPDSSTRMRRLAFLAVIAPTLYVFLGVVQTLVKSPFSDIAVWCAIWLAIVFRALRAKEKSRTVPRTASPFLRVVHGMSGAIVALYIAFHLGNHLAALSGPEGHARVMDAGRRIYRSPPIEPILVSLMVFQALSGLRLAWQWSASIQDRYRTFQTASGIYLAVFILGHMNSVFIYARAYLGIPTDWNFAIGGPAGLIHDTWNIRLLPHYGLGVFFVLAHMLSGLRVVVLAHGLDRRLTDRLWWSGVAISAAIAVAIIAGMCGIRLTAAI